MKRGLLIQAHPADVRLVHIGIHLHLRQVLGNQEQRGRLERGCHRLPDVHVPGNHDPVHGRPDVGVAEVHLRLLHRGLLLPDLRLGGRHLGLRHLERGLGGSHAGVGGVQLGHGGIVGRLRGVALLLRDPAFSEQARPGVQFDLGIPEGDLLAHDVRARVGEVGLRPRRGRPLVQDRCPAALEVGLGLVRLGVEDRGVDPGDQHAFRDRGVEVHQKLLDRAGHLRPDLDRDHRVQGTGRRDGRDQLTPLDGRGAVGRGPSVGAIPVEPAAPQQDQNHKNRNETDFPPRHSPHPL